MDLGGSFESRAWKDYTDMNSHLHGLILSYQEVYHS